MYNHEIWENHNDLFGDEKTGLDQIAAKVMGREMRKIAKRNDKLFARIENILNTNTEDISSSKMAFIMTEYFENTVEDNVVLLRELRQGFIE